MATIKLPPKPAKVEVLSPKSQKALSRFITANVIHLDDKPCSMARIIADCSEMVEDFTTASGKRLSGASKHEVTKYACHQIAQRNPKLKLDDHLDDTIKLTVDLSKGKFNINAKNTKCGWIPCGTVDIGVDKDGKVSFGFEPPVQDDRLGDDRRRDDPERTCPLPSDPSRHREEQKDDCDPVVPEDVIPDYFGTDGNPMVVGDNQKGDDQKGDTNVTVNVQVQAAS